MVVSFEDYQKDHLFYRVPEKLDNILNPFARVTCSSFASFIVRVVLSLAARDLR